MGSAAPSRAVPRSLARLPFELVTMTAHPRRLPSFSFFVAASSLGLTAIARAQCDVEHLTSAQLPIGNAWIDSLDVDGRDLVLSGSGFSQAAVLERLPSGWSTTLLPAGFQVFQSISSAIEGDWVALGNPEESPAGFLSGSVSLYQRTAGGWGLAQTLVPASLSVHHAFGEALALSDERLVVAATHVVQTGGDGDGQLYDFELSGGQWVETQMFQAQNAQPGFGRTLGLSGDWLAVGNPFDHTAASYAGSVVLFERLGGAWVESATLTGSTSVANDQVGAVLAMDGEQVLAAGASGALRAYLFELVGGAWVETQLFDLTGIVPNSSYLSLAIQGDVVLIGVPYPGGGSGLVRVYRRTGGTWDLERTIATPYADGDFATAVALGDAGEAFVGARPSRLSLYDLDGRSAPFCTATPNSTGAPAVASHTGCASAAEAWELRASPVPDEPGLFVYGTQETQVPFGNGFQCVAGPFVRTPIVLASGGVLAWSVDTALPPHDQLQAGTTWSFQAWFRDAQGMGAGFDTSSGVRVTVLP